MRDPRPSFTAVSLLAIAAALAWGLIEFVALWRSRWAAAWHRRQQALPLR